MAGKDKLTRYMRIYVGGYDLSGDARTFATADNNMAEVLMHGWSETHKNYLADKMRMIGIRGFQALMNDASGRAFDQLKNGSGGSTRTSLLFGGGAAPVVGDPAYMMPSTQMQEVAGMDGGAAVINADFLPDAAQVNANYDNPWGVVLSNDTSRTGTYTGSSVDNAASSANGGTGLLHVLASSGGTWTLKIQDSANDSAWADLITISADGSAVASEAGHVAGTVDRYTRALLTRTSGTLTAIVVFARN